MISKICLLLLLCCVLAQANPLSTRLRRSDPDPAVSTWKTFNQITAGLKSPIDALVAGIAMTSQAFVSTLASAAEAATSASPAIANGTNLAAQVAGDVVSSGAEQIVQMSIDAAAVLVEAQTSDHVAANPFAAMVGL